MGLLLVLPSCAGELMQFSVSPTKMQEFVQQVLSGQSLLFYGEQWEFLQDLSDFLAC